MESDEPPTALFSSQNLITTGVVRALVDLGLHRTTAFVGFDDVLLAESLQPGLTVLAQDPVGLGRAAAERLFARLDAAEWPPSGGVLPVRASERGWGGLPA